MTVGTVVLIVLAVLLVVAAFAVLTGVAALSEHRTERALLCSRCHRGGPFPEREMMALRDGRPTYCPDCGHQLARQRAERSP